jgi:hypothetical protein
MAPQLSSQLPQSERFPPRGGDPQNIERPESTHADRPINHDVADPHERGPSTQITQGVRGQNAGPHPTARPPPAPRAGPTVQITPTRPSGSRSRGAARRPPWQRLNLLTLLRAGQIRPQALIGLDLTDISTQRLRRNTEIARDMRDRTAALDDDPRAAIKQLRRILPWTAHDDAASPPSRTESSNRGLRETEPGSRSTSGTHLPD